MPTSSRPKPGSATPFPSLCTRSEVVQCLRIGCITSSLTSVIAELAVRDDPTGAQQAQAAQQCTRYSSNALDRRALHYLLSSATLRQVVQCHWPTSPRAAMCAPSPINKPPTEPDRTALHPFESIQPDREHSTRSEVVESSRSGVTPHR